MCISRKETKNEKMSVKEELERLDKIQEYGGCGVGERFFNPDRRRVCEGCGKIYESRRDLSEMRDEIQRRRPPLPAVWREGEDREMKTLKLKRIEELERKFDQLLEVYSSRDLGPQGAIVVEHSTSARVLTRYRQLAKPFDDREAFEAVVAETEKRLNARSPFRALEPTDAATCAVMKREEWTRELDQNASAFVDALAAVIKARGIKVED